MDKSVQAFLKIKSLLSDFGIITANNETEKLTKLSSIMPTIIFDPNFVPSFFVQFQNLDDQNQFASLTKERFYLLYSKYPIIFGIESK